MTSASKKKGGAPSANEEHALPVFLWYPNLIGYVRVLTLVLAFLEPDPVASFAMWYLIISLLLDYFDGPCARYFNMCSQFGDLLDHYTDHASMMWVVWVSSSSSHWTGQCNIAISVVHNSVAFLYMGYYGHYFKHSAEGNVVTRMIEANNYWNMPSILYCANTIVIPIVKLSFARQHQISPVSDATSDALDIADGVGAFFTAAYTIALFAQ